MTPTKKTKKLAEKIDDRSARISIIGLGYVGLPLAMLFVEAGYRVCGFDKDDTKIAALKKGKCYITEDLEGQIQKTVRQKKFLPTSTEKKLLGSDVFIICVPTPLNRLKNPDLTFLLDATEEVAQALQKGNLVVVESTTYPGTTDEVVLPILEGLGLRSGRDFHLCFSPERIDPGNPVFKSHNIPKIVGGLTPSCLKAGKKLYSSVLQTVVPVSSTRTAEMAKLLENTFRIVNIGLINELAQAAKSLGVDIWEAVDAAKSKPFGYMPFYPGPGVGGHCIGVDPLYLSWKAKYHGLDLKFIELARTVNAEMPLHVVSRIADDLNTYLSKSLKKSKILILGVTYKKNVNDIRESPVLEIMETLAAKGAQLSFSDPFIRSIQINDNPIKSIRLTPSVLKKADLVVITTDHDSVDYAQVVKFSKLIFDTRNVLKKFRQKKIRRL